jgi:hypothetical protein
MIAEKPAEGILKRNDWGDSKVYQIVCTCGDPDHDHAVWVEADDTGVSIVIYTTNTSTFWNKSRWRQVWDLFTKGYVKQEVSLIMNEQQVYNYADALTNAVNDVKLFKAKETAARGKKE